MASFFAILPCHYLSYSSLCFSSRYHSAFNVFTQVYVMTSDIQGAPGRLVRVLVYDIYENGFRYFKMGYASAEAVIFADCSCFNCF